jgi:APA family basic amino acid/polyamine antiporter
VIALSGSYEQILNYVVSMNFVFFGLSATCLFVLRRREALAAQAAGKGFRVPGHPYTTSLFIAACWLVVIDTIYKYPMNTLAGVAILLLGLPVYFVWHRLREKRDRTA